MFESSSCDWPMAIGWPAAFSLGAAAATWSQRRRRLPDRVPEVVPPDDRVRHVVVGHGEVLLRLRVVRRGLPERAVGPDLLLDLLDDRCVVDHLAFVRRHRVDGHEQVVPALGRDLRGRPRVEQRVVDVLHADLDVVALTPLLDPRVVEPVVVGRNEVDPLDDREVAFEGPVRESHRARERERGGRAGNPEHGRTGTGLLQQLSPAERCSPPPGRRWCPTWLPWSPFG